MYIIVVGGGRVGYYLTRALLEEGHEVLVIERETAICDAFTDEMGSICFLGDGCEASTLAEVGTDRADMLVAVTGDDEDNLVACQVAKHKFNVPRTIARIRNPRNEALFKKLGVDVTISSTNIILESIETEVPTHPITHLMTIRDKGLEIVEIKIPPESATVGKQIKQLSLPEGVVLSLIIRKERKPMVPSGTTILQAEDQVIAVTPPELEGILRSTLRDA
ncbi:MAG: TrkA family potassium uptake protein [Dehalococcoidales bacterium]|nr:TrkA family potassium uptake protein [Dehalococcoidales bacterium]MDZ4230462.1 TrkA family potassium uptake protein [Dehalococcoidales bacterium]